MTEIKQIHRTPKRKLIANFLLILTNVLWGTAFILTKNITEDVPIFLYMGIRFGFAFLGFVPMFFRLKNRNKRTLLMSILTGMIYFFGFAIQTLGLQTTTAGKAGFVTGLSAIIVPLIAWLGFKKRLNWRIWIAVILSIIGMSFLLLEGQMGIIVGDLIVLFSAFFWAFFIIFNDRFVQQVDIYAYSIIQMLIISSVSFLSSLILGESYGIFVLPSSFWYIMLYMGIGVMTLTIFFQNWSQQYQGPTHTAIIFTLEPVFAALFGFIIGNEILTISAWIGCGLIFTAILITVLKKANNETKE
ncbi:MAG: DMT family transporter [Promethearchaeota archaeon]|jgi:drug/metabolite transporter (DMT)-like permease